MKCVAILGATGSIGVNALRVVADHPQAFRVTGLAGGRNVPLLAEQIARFRPAVAAVLDEAHAGLLRERLGKRDPTAVRWGSEGYREVASLDGTDMVVSAMSGAAGLVPTVEAIAAGRDIALANKETMVMAGPLVCALAADKGASLIPVDSEHSAIFQCLQGQRREEVRELILTASGGPFLGRPQETLGAVTPEDALRHPNWTMGKKITVDSATMVNKSLEILEARWLFGIPLDRIRVLIHPQSVVHSLVALRDGAVLAQLGIPDMRIPIAYALSFPERLSLPDMALDLASAGPLTFSAPEPERFPALALAYRAGRAGGICPAVLNAANEEAVSAFLAGRLRFTDITEVVRHVLDATEPRQADRIDEILAADREARVRARRVMEERQA